MFISHVQNLQCDAVLAASEWLIQEAASQGGSILNLEQGGSTGPGYHRIELIASQLTS